MPLSEHEQRLLDQMERALADEDPKFASHMRGHRGVRLSGASVVGLVAFVAGLALVAVGVKTQWWIGIVGLVVMIAGGAYALAPRAGRLKVAGQRRVARNSGFDQPTRGAGSPFMQRLEDRWDRRKDETGW